MLLGSKCQLSYWLLDVDCGCILVLCTNFLHVCALRTLVPQSQILEKYWENWKRNRAAAVDFQYEGQLVSKSSVCGKLSNVKGREWKATLIDSEVS